MGMILFLAFLCVPIIEIIGFIQIGALIGLWSTIGIVILTAIAGSLLLQHQGMNALLQAQAKLRDGTLPLDEVIDGFCLALAGALLLTPGFFTDAFGFMLFVPGFRQKFARSFFEKVIKPNTVFYTNVSDEGEQAGPGQKDWKSGDQPGFDDGVVIDGSYQDVSDSEQAGGSMHVPDAGVAKGENKGANKGDRRGADPTDGSSPWNKQNE